MQMLYISELNCPVTAFEVRSVCYTLWLLFFICPHSDSSHKELERVIGTKSGIHCLVTTFVTLATLSADYFCLVSYISSDGHFSEV